jgi:hypothetical protein
MISVCRLLAALCCMSTAIAIATAVSAWAELAAADPMPGVPVNLFPDGDCEHVDHGPQDWAGFGPGAEIVDDPDQPAGHVLRLVSSTSAPAPVIHATIIAHAMKRLLVKLRLRTADLHPSSDAPAVTVTVSGRGLGAMIQLAQLSAGRNSTDLPWTPLAAFVDVPTGIFVLSVSAAVNGTGTAWIDDVTLIADPAVPAEVIGTQIPSWNFSDAETAGIVIDPSTGANWLHLQSDRYATAVAWGAMAADWKRIAVSLRLRGDGLVLGAVARNPGSATTPAGGVPQVRAGVLATWVDDHDHPLGATFDDLCMPTDGDWTAMQLHLDVPRPGAKLRLTALIDGGGTLDIDSMQILPIQVDQ